MGRGFLTVGIAWVLGCAAPAARGGEDPLTEKAFLADVEKARATLASGKPADGLKQLEGALQRHEGRDYARAKRVDLEDLVRRLAFAAEAPAPQPKDVVNGKLLSYSSNPSKVKIVYTSKDHDFKQSGGNLWMHPARFTGAFSIEVHGEDYPKDTQASPQVLIGMVDNPKTGREETWQVLFGCAPYDRGSSSVWLPAKILFHDGKDKKTLDEKEISPAKPGADFRLQVNVASTRIVALINGSKMLSAAKSGEVFGHVAFECPKWTTVHLEGAVEPSWIQGQIDAIVQARLAEFDKRFDVKRHLPAWLFEAGAPPSTADTPAAEDAPDVPEDLRRDVDALDKRLRQEDYEGVLGRIAELRSRGGSDALWGYLSARANMGLSRLTAALTDLDQALAAAPGFAGAHLARGIVLYRLGRGADAETSLRRAAESNREYAEPAALYLLLADRADAARGVTEAAASRGERSQGLDTLGRVLVKALRGPDWPKVFEVKSANYHVLSDIDQETCKQASQVLEEALAAYKSNLQGVKKGPQRLFRVYLFRGRAGFGSYYEDVSLYGSGAPANAAGLYSPVLKQLLIWNLPSRDEMMKTVRHEGFHQYLDRLLPDAPTWFNEGLACYYETLERVGGQVRYGVRHPDYVDALEQKGLTPLGTFFAIPHRKFYEDPARNYGQAWLFCHMLRHGTPQHKELLKALLLRLEIDPPHEAVAAVFPAPLLAKLDADLAKYLAGMAKDR
jgi:tetratricopeptide (TPR) repeat protein